MKHTCSCNETKKKYSCSCCDEEEDLMSSNTAEEDESSSIECTICTNRSKEDIQYINGVPICSNCISKFAKELKYADDLTGMGDMVNGARLLLTGLSKMYGIDPNDANFRDTPKRVARLMMELNYGTNLKAAHDILTVSFPTDNGYDGLISANNIRVSSLCPHHMVVVDYDVSVAYVPSGGRCIGLSKLPRVAKVLAKSMCLQEDYTKKLVDVIDDILKPAGCAAYVRGVHNCVQARGAEMRDVANVTIALKGVFACNPTLKDEWLFTIKDSHNK